jgi:hypothetical protein
MALASRPKRHSSLGPLRSIVRQRKARELIIHVDNHPMRVSWSAFGGRLTHHNASNRVLATGECSCTLLRVADLKRQDAPTQCSGKSTID